MSKLLIVNGSPREKGNTVILADKIGEAAKAKGMQVKTVYLSQLSIAPCMACETCSSSDENCVIKDDMQNLYEDVLWADSYVFATPVYWFSVTAYMKIFWDRLYGVYQKDEAFMANKNAAFVICHGDESVLQSGASNAYRCLYDAFTFSGGSVLGAISSVAAEEGDVLGDDKALKMAESLGAALALEL